ncbi:MAG TPA: hypothetical protein VM070_07840 [Candidatus Saccharimonadales bacterium]|nr:hypothetical protein [Candidatus Saccharimonadales bacterium]
MLLWQLARSPRIGTAAVLLSGRLRTAAILIAIATAVAAANALRVAADVPIAAILYGDQRSPAVTMLIDLLGRERTAVVLYLVERSWDAVLVLTGVAPLFYWLLGSTAVHAAARMRARPRPYRPMLVLLGYAVPLTRIPADLAGLALGSGSGVGPRGAELIGTLSLFLLGVITWRGIQAHYGLARRPALRMLLLAVVLFYAVPLAVIVLAIVGLVIAAIVLGYVPEI